MNSVPVRGFLGPLVITCGFAGAPPVPPLVVNQQLHSNELGPESGNPFSGRYESVGILTSPAPTPWSIDPERTRQLR
jgi:hypothetical protein